jgi:hypothetical protein
MSKASKRRRPVAASAPPGSAGRASASADPEARGLRFDSVDLLLLGIAGGLWLIGHLPGQIGVIAVPLWVVAGLAVGVYRPWLGLVLTLATVPFLGGAVDQPVGEVLRVVPIYGALARVLVDRVAGRSHPTDPPVWITLTALAAGALYVWTFATFLSLVGGDVSDLPYAGWLVGGPAAGMAAWVVASHAAAGRHDEVADVVLVVTVVAVLVALAAFVHLPGTDLVAFPALVADRLSALGYPTPTGIGLAIALPFAFAAGWRRHWLLGAGVGALIVGAIVLTGSRGPLLAVAAGAVVAVLVRGQLNRRLVLGLAGAGILMVIGYALFRYGRDPSNWLSTMLGQLAGDSARVQSWWAGIAITLANPVLGGGWHALSTHGYDQLAQGGTIQSHNLFLHAFAEGGLPLGLAHGAVVLYSAFQAWRSRHVTAPFVTAAVVIYLVCGLWDFPQVRAYGAVLGGVALGLAAIRVQAVRPGMIARSRTSKARDERSGGRATPAA